MKLIFENKLGKVHHNRFLDYNLAIKTTSDTQKIKEHIHETFIGTKITNLLSKYIPNFVYIFVLYKKDKSFNVVTEKIDGETLFSYLHSKSFDFQVFLLLTKIQKQNKDSRINSYARFSLLGILF